MNQEKGFIVPLLLVVGLSLAIGSGVYVHNKEKTDPSSTTPETETTDVAAKSSTHVTYKTSGNTLTVLKNGVAMQNITLSADTIDAIQGAPEDKRFITDTDINFDGHNDAAILTGVGYNGVNYFYDYYLFREKTGHLEKSTALVEVSNPVLNNEKKEIESSYRDGPSWYTQNFKFDEKKGMYTKLDAILSTE